MSPDISIPPLRDLPPGRLEARKQHVLSEIERRRPARVGLSQLISTRRRIAGVAIGAGVALAGASTLVVALTTATSHDRQVRLSRTATSQLAIVPSRPQGYAPITVDLTRGGDGTASIKVTVNAPFRDASLQLQVLRGEKERQVVFQEDVPMDNIASPTNGPPGVFALSTWSDTLSSSSWEGGCGNDQYAVSAKVSSSSPSSMTNGMTALSEWFSCSSD